MSIDNNNTVIDINNHHDDYSSVRSKIKKELIDPSYYNDVKYNLQWRSNWKWIGDVSEVLSKIFIGIAAVIAFASGFFGHTYLSFISGCLSTLSFITLHFSAYAMKESKESNYITNRLLEKLGLDDMVNIAIEPDENDNDLKILTRPPGITDKNKNQTL